MPFEAIHSRTPFGRFLQKQQDVLGLSNEVLSARWKLPAQQRGTWYPSRINALKYQRGENRPIFLAEDAIILGEILQVSPIVLQALYFQDREFSEEIDWTDPRILPTDYGVYWNVMRLLPESDRQLVLEYLLMLFSHQPLKVRRQVPPELKSKVRGRGLSQHPLLPSESKKPRRSASSSGEPQEAGEQQHQGEVVESR